MFASRNPVRPSARSKTCIPGRHPRAIPVAGRYLNPRRTAHACPMIDREPTPSPGRRPPANRVAHGVAEEPGTVEDNHLLRLDFRIVVDQPGLARSVSGAAPFVHGRQPGKDDRRRGRVDCGSFTDRVEPGCGFTDGFRVAAARSSPERCLGASGHDVQFEQTRRRGRETPGGPTIRPVRKAGTSPVESGIAPGSARGPEFRPLPATLPGSPLPASPGSERGCAMHGPPAP